MAPVIDEALDRLHRPDRDAIFLRYVEGRSLREVGDSLGVSEEAAKKRVARALEKLRQALVRNGVAFSGAAIASGLTTNATAATPAAVMVALSTNALAATNGFAGTLVNEVLTAWRLTKLKWAGAALLIALLCTFPFWPKQNAGTEAQTRIADANDKSNVATTPAADLSGTKTQATAAVAWQADGSRSLRLQVVAADSGEPVTNARVALNTVFESDWTNRFDLVTDGAGICRVSFPPNTTRIDLGVITDGWGARYATWPADGIPGFASEYTLRLPRVSNYLGGVVTDPQGRPLAAVDISFQGQDAGDASSRERAREHFGFITPLTVTRADERGRWRIGFVPDQHRGFQLEATHSEFPNTLIAGVQPDEFGATAERDEVKQLWAETLRTRLQPGFTLAGSVHDEHGAAIANARIQERSDTEVFPTDGAGQFRVRKLPPGKWSFVVTAEGFAPIRTNAMIGAIGEPLVITLQTGGVLRVRVVDELGTEVPGITIGLEEWGEGHDDFGWKGTTDRNGRVEWRSAPRGEPFDLYATGENYCHTRRGRVQADGSEHLLHVRQQLVVHGRVVNAETGRGIRDFKVVPASDEGEGQWDLGNTVRGTNGVFKLTFTEAEAPWVLRVSADEYEDWISAPITNRESAVLDIALKKSRLEESVRGIVELPDGTPAAGAIVGLLTFDNDFTLRKKTLEGNKRWLKTTGPGGEFAFTANRLAHSVAAVGEAGFVVARVPDPREPVTLRLQPWGRIEGEVAPDAQANPIQELRLYDPFAQNYQGKVSLLDSYAVKPGPGMRFVFENVPPGEFAVSINSGLGIPFHHLTLVRVSPGETAHCTLGNGSGTVIKGKINLPAGIRFSEHDQVSLIPERESVPFQQLRGEEQKRAALEFWTSPAGREYWLRQRNYSTKPADNGAFIFRESIPPGQYTLWAATSANSTETNIVVPTDFSADIDVGEIPLGLRVPRPQ